MKEKPIPVEHRNEKACLCRLAPNSKVFMRPTHQHDSQGRAEVKCWLCGRTGYLAS